MSVAERIYLHPSTVEDALGMAVEYENNFRYLAGGTDVMVNKFQGNDPVHCLIDLTGIQDLKSISIEDENLLIGSLVTLDTLARIPEVLSFFPALSEAALSAASPVLRRTATIGGNILCENRCSFYNQSEWWREAVGYCLKCDGDVCIATGGTKKCFSRFISDTVPILIACHARLLYTDKNGEQEVNLEEIYTGDGLNPRKLTRDAIVKKIMLPLGEKLQGVFMKLRPRLSMDFTSLTTAVTLSPAGRIKIVLGGLDPKPVVITGKIGEKDELIRQAIKKPRIVDNDFYSRTYRKDMIGVFLKRSFEKLEAGP